MSRNRRRNTNPVPIRALSPGLVLAAICLIGGMTWVYFKNQLVTRGKEIKALETELANLNIQNEALRPRIAELSSRTALQKRLNEGFIKLIPIPQDRIVQVSLGARSAREVALVGNEIRAVANPGAGR